MVTVENELHLTPLAMSSVLPGDTIPAPAQHHLKLGPGLLQVASAGASTGPEPIIATRAGVLKNSDGKRWWVERDLNRYTPSVGESVVGIITARHAEGYRVDIGAAHQASLDALAFEGSSKRNKPNLKVGSLVYARVSLAHRDMEPELECVDPTTHKSEGFGDLKAGFMVSCSLGLARAFLMNTHPLLTKLGARFPFEIAIGTNGRVWFKAPEIAQTIALAKAVQWANDQGTCTDTDVRLWIESNVDV